MQDFTVIIPARYAATRLPGKMLLSIGEKTIIEHSYARACASGAARVIVATDDTRIEAVMRACGAEVCLTPTSCRSGSERLAAACAQLGLVDSELVVNLQGDEPFMPPQCINLCAQTLSQNPDCPVATLAVACPKHELTDPHAVKVVLSKSNHALYFSRAPIPYARGEQSRPALRHLGIYGYRAGFLAQYTQLEPTPLEQSEQLEQLRILEHCSSIAVAISAEVPPAGIDSPADLEKAREHYQGETFAKRLFSPPALLANTHL